MLSNRLFAIGFQLRAKLNYTKFTNVKSLILYGKTDLRYRRVPGANLKEFQKCYIHTSPKRFNPIISTIARQVIKVVAVFTGRAIRNWWRTLPDNKRKQVFLWLIKHKWKFMIPFLLLIGTMFLYYQTHIQETIITKRKRFIAFTPQQFALLNKLELEAQLEAYRSKLLPTNHPFTVQVATVARQLLDKNKDIEQINQHDWSVSVIDDPDTMNAFVLASGNIFVFSGLLKICENSDQLGIVLSHEMSHAILQHGIEMASHAHIVDMVFIVLIGFLWILLPTDAVAAMGTAFSRFIMRILLDTPYSKMLETEADEVGLELAAKACFDVRESSAFWNKMALIEKAKLDENGQSGDISINLDFLTTHPSHEKRCENLNSLLESAIKCRSENGCPSLPKIDPRQRVLILKDLLATQGNNTKYEGVLKLGDVKNN